MAKRKTFYVATDLFETDMPPKAKLVLAYLSRCANRRGICFPSVTTIAQNCGVCKNTARKALRALETAGLISIQSNYTTTKTGRRRRRTNTYTLHFPAAKTDLPPVQKLHGGGSKNGGEINDNSKLTIAVPSVGINAREKTGPENAPKHAYAAFSDDRDKTEPVNAPAQAYPSPCEDRTGSNACPLQPPDRTEPPDRRRPSACADRDRAELADILDGLHLDLYEDRAFACGVEQAIRTMFDADRITVKGNRIPQSAVRNVLHALTIDHIDYIQAQLRLNEKEIAHGEPYLISCLYNAPIDCMINRIRHGP